MDFGYYPPSESELGHGKKFYEPNVGNFFYREESWGTSFVGDSDYGSTGGSFNNGIVDLITISPLSGGTFQGLNLRVKPDRFAELLEQAGMAFEVRREDEIVTIALEPGGNEPAEASKPHVEFVFEDENTELPAVRWISPGSHELSRYLLEHGWRATSDGFAFDDAPLGGGVCVLIETAGEFHGDPLTLGDSVVEEYLDRLEQLPLYQALVEGASKEPASPAEAARVNVTMSAGRSRRSGFTTTT